MIQVLVDDGLPTVICLKCINQLINAYNFKKQCEKVDILFRQNVQEIQQTQEFEQIQEIKPSQNEHDPADSPVSVHGFADHFLDDEIYEKNDSEQPLPDRVLDQNGPVDKKEVCKSSLPIVETPLQGICIKYLDISSLNEDHYDFQCKICDQIFTQHNSVNKHMVTHLKRKLYTCNACTIAFVREISLEKHIKREGKGRCQGQPVIWCPLCLKIYKTEELLQIHRKENNKCKEDVKVCLNFLSQGDQYIYAIENKNKKCGKKKKKTSAGIVSDDEIPLADRILGKNKSNYVPVDVSEADDDERDSSFEPEGNYSNFVR